MHLGRLLGEPLAVVLSFRTFVSNVADLENQQQEELKLAEMVSGTCYDHTICYCWTLSS